MGDLFPCCGKILRLKVLSLLLSLLLLLDYATTTKVESVSRCFRYPYQGCQYLGRPQKDDDWVSKIMVSCYISVSFFFECVPLCLLLVIFLLPLLSLFISLSCSSFSPDCSHLFALLFSSLQASRFSSLTTEFYCYHANFFSYLLSYLISVTCASVNLPFHLWITPSSRPQHAALRFMSATWYDKQSIKPDSSKLC